MQFSESPNVEIADTTVSTRSRPHGRVPFTALDVRRLENLSEMVQRNRTRYDTSYACACRASCLLRLTGPE